MSNQDELLQKAENSRRRALRARQMAGYLTQRGDVERITAYAADLEHLADEMERSAGSFGIRSRDGDSIGEFANA